MIWDICSEYSWALPAHIPFGIQAVKDFRLPPEQVVDLFAAETAHALAETLYLLEDRLDPWISYRIRQEIEKRIFQLLFYTPGHFWWESATLNWASVCSGAVGMAALILVDDWERLSGLINRVVCTMECFLEGYGNDGGCPEGIASWNY